eukprot:3181913-Rhodomonas_salina.1
MLIESLVALMLSALLYTAPSVGAIAFPQLLVKPPHARIRSPRLARVSHAYTVSLAGRAALGRGQR